MSDGLLVPEVLLLAPLAVAAGIDLYLALLFVAVAPALGWPAFDPAGLGSFSTLPLAALAAGLYLVEARLDRSPPLALGWNVVHTVVRPMATGLLAVLLLHDHPLPVVLAGSMLASALTAGVHTARTGWAFLLWAGRARAGLRLMASAAEDVLALALLALSLEHPEAGAALTAGVVVVGGTRARVYLQAGIYAHALIRGAVAGWLGRRGWRAASDFPPWLRARLEKSSMDVGLSPRGAPGALSGHPRPGLFTTGWLVLTGDQPVFVPGRAGRSDPIRLGRARSGRVTDGVLGPMVELEVERDRRFTLLLGRDGPGIEALREEFGLTGPAEEPEPDEGVAQDRRAEERPDL